MSIWSSFGRRWVALPDAATAGSILKSYFDTLYLSTSLTRREVLSANRTYYVRTDGSDSNTGLVDSAGGAFLTIQKAVNVALTLDLAGFQVVIQVGAGTYTGNISMATPVLGGTLIIQGDTTTPANVILSVNGFGAISATYFSRFTIRGFKITNAHVIGQCLYASAGGVIDFSSIEFSTASRAHIEVLADGLVNVLGNYTISGAAPRHVYCNNGGNFILSSRTVTITGTPAFSTAFVRAEDLSLVAYTGATFVGTATGARYSIASNAVVRTGGGGATYFPGDVAGATATGGQYV